MTNKTVSFDKTDKSVILSLIVATTISIIIAILAFGQWHNNNSKVACVAASNNNQDICVQLFSK